MIQMQDVIGSGRIAKFRMEVDEKIVIPPGDHHGAIRIFARDDNGYDYHDLVIPVLIKSTARVE